MRDLEDLFFFLGRPLSPGYGLVALTRRLLYRRGILRSYKVEVPVVSIGNILLGGTGKTPHVLQIALWLMEKGICPAIVSRGYKGHVGKGPLVLFDGKELLFPPEVSGDEPFMMGSFLKEEVERSGYARSALVVVGSDRVRGAREAIRRGAEVVILDDGFQHLRLQRDLDILLFPFGTRFDSLRPFPGGRLREPLSSCAFSNGILITKCPRSLNEREKARYLGRFGKARTFFSRYVSSAVLLFERPGSLGTDTICGKEVALFCGIGDPESFKNHIEGMGISVKGVLAFRDHHAYTLKDISKIRDWGRSIGVDTLLTTEKDMARLQGLIGGSQATEIIGGMEVFALRIEPRPEERFFRFIEKGLGL